jgi:hypothetical protein
MEKTVLQLEKTPEIFGQVLLSAAQRISVSRTPYPSWSLEKPLYLHKPPYPTEDLMRCSELFKKQACKSKPKDLSIIVNNSNEAQINPSVDSLRKSFRHHEADGNEILDLDLNPDLL